MLNQADTTTHQPEHNRYLVQFHDGGQGELVYKRHGNVLNLVHSQVPSNRRGEGLGARLMDNALAQIKAESLKVQPICSYTQHYITRHAQWHELLATSR